MSRLGILLVVTATAGLIVAAERSPDAAPVTPADDDVVRVYTNADLAGLPPLPVMEPAMPPASDDDWLFVQAFIASQRAKLADERDRDLERQRIELERQRLQPEPRYALPLSFLPFGPYACNGIGSLHCRPNDDAVHPGPPRGDRGDRGDRGRGGRDDRGDEATRPRPGRPLPESQPATARVGARSDD